MNPRNFLRRLFEAAIGAVQASACLPPHLPPAPAGRLFIIGAGKASGAMARTAADHYGAAVEAGLIVTRYGYAGDGAGNRIRVVEAGHPAPDNAGVAATREMLGMIAGLGADDLVVALISGGGSSLLVAPAGDITLADKQAITSALLDAGAPIDEVNCVRRHLSAVKGGRLAARAAPAAVATFAVSDVVGDRLEDIASGPTVPDPTTREDARAILNRRHVRAAPAIWSWLERPDAETPKPGDAVFERCTGTIVASGRTALQAAAAAAADAGVTPIVLGDDIAGDAQAIAEAHARLAERSRAGAAPAVILSGGEATVNLGGASARGGPNTEYALALALALNGAPGIFALAADTDGTDGRGGHAGAIVDPATLARARNAGIDPRDHLRRHESYAVFEATGDLLAPGPTQTNVNDFRAILVVPETETAAANAGL